MQRIRSAPGATGPASTSPPTSRRQGSRAEHSSFAEPEGSRSRYDGTAAQRAKEKESFLTMARPPPQDTTKIAAMHAEKVLAILSMSPACTYL